MRDGTFISKTAVVPARATNIAVVRQADFPKEKFISPIYQLGIDDSGKPKEISGIQGRAKQACIIIKGDSCHCL